MMTWNGRFKLASIVYGESAEGEEKRASLENELFELRDRLIEVKCQREQAIEKAKVLADIERHTIQLLEEERKAHFDLWNSIHTDN